MQAQLVTLHVYGVPARRVPLAAARMGPDGLRLRGADGLEFFKLLGTGDGETFSLRDANPRRWAVLAVWRSRAALQAFERSRVAQAWRRLASEWYRVDLRPLRAKGSWGGRQPFRLPASGCAQPSPGAVAALTHARLRPATMRSFWRAVPPVAVELHAQPGLRFALGIGEQPFGVQGTFSLWDSAEALSNFAYGGAAHRSVIGRTQRERWYHEDLFARFAVLSSTGTVDGFDPLAGAR